VDSSRRDIYRSRYHYTIFTDRLSNLSSIIGRYIKYAITQDRVRINMHVCGRYKKKKKLSVPGNLPATDWSATREVWSCAYWIEWRGAEVFVMASISSDGEVAMPDRASDMSTRSNDK